MSDTLTARTPRARLLAWGAIEIRSFAPALDASKSVVSDGPPIGLGALEKLRIRRVESYDGQREKERQGARGCFERRVLACSSPCAPELR